MITLKKSQYLSEDFMPVIDDDGGKM